MSRSRIIRNSLFALGGGVLFCSQNSWGQALYTQTQGNNFGGGAGADLTGCVVSNDASNLNFIITLNPAANDIANNYFLYELGFQTNGGTGGQTLVSGSYGTAATDVNPYGQQDGISTGETYWAGSYLGGTGYSGASQLYSFNSTNGWTSVVNATLTESANTITFSYPLADLGLNTGSAVNFDLWSTFGNPGGQSAYDALDAGASLTTIPNYSPYSNTAVAGSPTPYDSATEPNSLFSTTVYTVAQGSSWSATGTGAWDTPGNWSNGEPNGVGVGAYLTGATAGTSSVTMNVPITVGALEFGNSNNYTISGSGTLTLQGGSTSDGRGVAASQVIVESGSQTIGVAVNLVGTAYMTVASGANLAITGPISGSGGIVLPAGGGVLTLSGSESYTGGTTLDGSTLAIPSDAEVQYGANLTVNGGTLQFNNYTSTLSFAVSNLSLGAATGAPATLAGNISNGSLTFVGPGTLILTGSNSFAGSTNINAGTLAIGNDAEINNGSGGVNFNGGTLQFDNYTSSNLSLFSATLSLGAATGAASTFAASIGDTNTGSTNLTFVGPGTLSLTAQNSYTGSTNVNAGLLQAGTAGALPNNTTLTVGTATSTGHLQLAAGIGAVTVSALTVNTGSNVDLTNNPLIVNYGGNTDPIGTVQQYLTDGFNAGWSGGELMSSTVASLNAHSTLKYALGYIDGALPPVNYTGPVPPAGEIEIMPTLAGDATLSGTVNFYDFQVVLSNFGKSGQAWDQGDFDYAAAVDFYDFQVVLSNFGQSDTALSSSQLATLNNFAAQSGHAVVDGPAGLSLVSVPEPASIGLMAAGGLALLSRRRRRDR